MAKAFAESGETPGGEYRTTHARQRLTLGIRFVLKSALLLKADNQQGDVRKAPVERIRAATGVQPLNEARWWDSEMPDGFSRMAARRKLIGVTWDEPLAAWCQPMKVEK